MKSIRMVMLQNGMSSKSNCAALVQPTGRLRNAEGALHPSILIRNPLLEPRVWILDIVFEKYLGRFWPITTDWGLSGPQKTILEDLTALATSHESSGARLGPNFLSIW